MEGYETLAVLGEGTYGVVIKARHRATGQLVAIKKFKQTEDDDHVRKTSLREVRVLKQLHHTNVVALLDVFRRDGKLYLVFEYIENTILQLLECTSRGLPAHEVRKYTYQLLRGVDYCHAHNIIHRDVKPENILVSYDGVLKVCDFGFARHMTAKGKYTDYVATRWYRPPELLVGEVSYGKAVDVWAVGCILAELTDGQPLFPGDSDLDQLSLILKTCGAVPQRMVQLFERNPLYRRVSFPHTPVTQTLRQRYSTQPPEWLEFLSACLHTDPDARPSCSDLMNLPYFTKDNFRNEYEAELRNLSATTLTPSLNATPRDAGSNSSPRSNKQHPQQASGNAPKLSATAVGAFTTTTTATSGSGVEVPSSKKGSQSGATTIDTPDVVTQHFSPLIFDNVKDSVPPLPSISPFRKESVLSEHITSLSGTQQNARVSLAGGNNSNGFSDTVSGALGAAPATTTTATGTSMGITSSVYNNATSSPSEAVTSSLFPQLGVLWTQYLGNNSNNNSNANNTTGGGGGTSSSNNTISGMGSVSNVHHLMGGANTSALGVAGSNLNANAKDGFTDSQLPGITSTATMLNRREVNNSFSNTMDSTSGQVVSLNASLKKRRASPTDNARTTAISSKKGGRAAKPSRSPLASQEVTEQEESVVCASDVVLISNTSSHDASRRQSKLTPRLRQPPQTKSSDTGGGGASDSNPDSNYATSGKGRQHTNKSTLDKDGDKSINSPLQIKQSPCEDTNPLTTPLPKAATDPEDTSTALKPAATSTAKNTLATTTMPSTVETTQGGGGQLGKKPSELSRATATQLVLSSFRSGDVQRVHMKDTRGTAGGVGGGPTTTVVSGGLPQNGNVNGKALELSTTANRAPDNPHHTTVKVTSRKKKRTVLSNLGNHPVNASVGTSSGDAGTLPHSTSASPPPLHLAPTAYNAPAPKPYNDALRSVYGRSPYVYPPQQHQQHQRDPVYAAGSVYLGKLRHGPGGNHGYQQQQQSSMSREIKFLEAGGQKRGSTKQPGAGPGVRGPHEIPALGLGATPHGQGRGANVGQLQAGYYKYLQI